MSIYWPSDTVDTIDAIREAIGRDITIYVTVSGVACTASGCFLDPVTNLSTNPFCVTCEGKHWIDTVSGYEVLAHVRHGPLDIPWMQSAGDIYKGDTTIQIKYTVLNSNAVDNASYYEVDGRIYLAESVNPRGVQDINRLIIILK